MQFFKTNIHRFPKINKYAGTKQIQLFNPFFCGTRHYLSDNKSPLKRCTVFYSTNIAINECTIPAIKELLNYIEEDKTPNLHLIVDICKSIDFSLLSINEANFLLKCCGSLIPNSPRESRDKACQNIFDNLLKSDKLDLSIYKTYISVCTENDILINSDHFLAFLKCEPDGDVLKLLLENACKKGNITQGFKLLEKMKEYSFAADENVFNNLVLASAIVGGIKSGEAVLKTMRTAQISETPSTVVALLKGLIVRGNQEEFKQSVEKLKRVTELQFLEIVEYLGLTENHQWIDNIKHFYKRLDISREFISDLKKICIHLVHMKRSKSSFHIWMEFVDPSFDENYAFFLLKEMLCFDTDLNSIIEFALDIRSRELNPYIIENLTEVALRQNLNNEAETLLKYLPTLRSHFFWPLLCSAGKEKDEIKLFSVLQEMQNSNLKLDFEGLDCYFFRYCELNDTKIINKLQNVGYSLREIISPLIVQLLRRNNIKECASICKMYDKINIYSEQFVTLLGKCWASTNDSKSAVYLLKIHCDSKKNKSELVGEFIIKSLKSCKDFEKFTLLLREIDENQLSTNYGKSEVLHKLCLRIVDTNLRKDIISKIDSLVRDDVEPESNFIPLPKHMDVEELECHLIELQEKGLKTRGVLRHLIRLHTNQGNKKRVSELYEQLKSEGYVDSPGIKSSLIHSYVMSGNVDKAIEGYKELKESNPTFRLDSFKTIDLARLLIENDRFEEAKELLIEEARNVSGVGKTVERNCIELLSACRNEQNLRWCLNYIIENKCCNPTVHIFAPLVQYFITQGNIDKIVDSYVECATKFKCTPLQLKVFTTVLNSQNEELLLKIVRETQKIHGNTICQFILITSLAENGLQKPLEKILIQNSIPIDDLMRKQCQKWVLEKNLVALKTLASASTRMQYKILDKVAVYRCIMQIYDEDKNCKEAIRFFESINDDHLSHELEPNLQRILKKHDFKNSITLKNKS